MSGQCQQCSKIGRLAHSFSNIDESNNVFVYSPDNGNSWVKIKIPEGSYEIDDTNNTVRHKI